VCWRVCPLAVLAGDGIFLKVLKFLFLPSTLFSSLGPATGGPIWFVILIPHKVLAFSFGERPKEQMATTEKIGFAGGQQVGDFWRRKGRRREVFVREGPRGFC